MAFHEYLETFIQKITVVDERRQIYMEDFEIIRDRVLELMKAECSGFKDIFKGYSNYGGYNNNVHIENSNEFEVYIELSFPFTNKLRVYPDSNIAGAVTIDFQNVMSILEPEINNEIYNFLDASTDWFCKLLRTSTLHSWLKLLIEDSLNAENAWVPGKNNDLYELTYEFKDHSHRINADGAFHTISIHIVPVILININKKWMKVPSGSCFKNKCQQFYAVPKLMANRVNVHSFILINPVAEYDLILSNTKIKSIFRLLKSMRRAKNIPQLKSYIITNAFLHQLNEGNKEIWSADMTTILTFMLDKLAHYFKKCHLPFFWDGRRNLLSSLSEEEIGMCGATLKETYDTINKYPDYKILSWQECALHFFVPREKQEPVK